VNSQKLKRLLVFIVLLETLFVGTHPPSHASEVLSHEKMVTMINTLMPLAKSGEAEAQLQLAAYMGFLPNPDYNEIVMWITASANQGYTPAQLIIGSMYRDGELVPQDYGIAIKWYTAAAEDGDAKAQFNLGWMYDFGEGVPQDYKIASNWFTLAAKQGYTPAQKFLNLERYR
jgi:uncharacterized protein